MRASSSRVADRRLWPLTPDSGVLALITSGGERRYLGMAELSY